MEPLRSRINTNSVKFAAVGQRVARPADQILGLLQIQFQGEGRGLRGLVVGVIPDFEKMLLPPFPGSYIQYTTKIGDCTGISAVQ